MVVVRVGDVVAFINLDYDEIVRCRIAVPLRHDRGLTVLELFDSEPADDSFEWIREEEIQRKLDQVYGKNLVVG